MSEYTHDELTYHVKEARKAAEAQMRERAAKEADKPPTSWITDDIAKRIRALPLTEGKTDD